MTADTIAWLNETALRVADVCDRLDFEDASPQLVNAAALLVQAAEHLSVKAQVLRALAEAQGLHDLQTPFND